MTVAELARALLRLPDEVQDQQLEVWRTDARGTTKRVDFDLSVSGGFFTGRANYGREAPKLQMRKRVTPC